MKSYEDEDDPGIWESSVDCQESGGSKFLRLKKCSLAVRRSMSVKMVSED